MSKINILDDHTINKIAAGEVVERPVSVVKELVENAMDSGAKNISIEIKGGGIDLIRVSDNGSGIEKESIKNAFLRHATSKISSAEDLMHITSLGFRGEALSSIAAVSQTELLTKTPDSLLGYRYVIHGGREMSFDEAGVPDGTCVIVRNLFYNTPARLKFLKSAATEGNYITELVERLILSHPDISFKYVSQGALKRTSGGQGDLEADIYSIFGRDIQRSLVKVDRDLGDISISGYVGKPEIARGNRNYELFFVNGRLIKSRILTSAVEEAYKPYLMQHRFPFCVLYFDMPSELLDVNVHPSKTEIRFKDERTVFDATVDTVTEGIRRRELIPEAAVPEEKPVLEEHHDIKSVMVPEPFETASISSYKKAEPPKHEIKPAPVPVQETLFKEGFLDEKNVKKHRLIGQVFDTYWMIEYEDKLYVIDQHAAHEKVLFERFWKQIETNCVMSQIISPPIIITLTGPEEAAVRDHIEEFSELGFTIEHFGGREYAVSSVPCELFGMSEKDYLIAVIDDLMENDAVKAPEQVKDRIATMACKAAVKGNMSMTFAEADALISEMLTLDNPYNCPHGRPTVISFSESDLEKLFKRIV